MLSIVLSIRKYLGSALKGGFNTISLLILTGVICYGVGFLQGANKQPKTVTEFIERPTNNVPEPIIITEEVPVQVIKWRTKEVVSVDTHYVPVPTVIGDDFRVASQRPISIEVPRYKDPIVNYTYYDPRSGRFQTDRFEVKTRKFGVDTFLGIDIRPQNLPVILGGLRVRAGPVTIKGGYEIDNDSNYGPFYGVELKLRLL